MSSFFTTLKGLFGTSTSTGRRKQPNVEPEAVRVPVQEDEAAKSSGRLASCEAPEGKEFYVHDGPAVATVRELADALNQASQETFQHHLSGDQNDFARWIREVFADDAAAAVVESARNPSEIVYILDTLSQQ